MCRQTAFLSNRNCFPIESVQSAFFFGWYRWFQHRIPSRLRTDRVPFEFASFANVTTQTTVSRGLPLNRSNIRLHEIYACLVNCMFGARLKFGPRREPVLIKFFPKNFPITNGQTYKHNRPFYSAPFFEFLSGGNNVENHASKSF